MRSGYGQLRLRQQGEDAQARGLAGGLERAIEGLERQVGNGGHDVGADSRLDRPHPFWGGHKDIFMPLTEDCKIGVGSPTQQQSLPGSGRA